MSLQKNEIRYYGAREEKINKIIEDKLVSSMTSKESKRKNTMFGIKILMITIFFIVGGSLLIIWGIHSIKYKILKYILSVLCFIIAFTLGIITYSVLIPPKYVNGFGKFDNK